MGQGYAVRLIPVGGWSASAYSAADQPHFYKWGFFYGNSRLHTFILSGRSIRQCNNNVQLGACRETLFIWFSIYCDGCGV